ncbi:NAC domain-containing protein 83-like protein [Cinnamomum micranthum f. kanehirae]|uniref:NAC domain-containing protein 83-like protein n=1 Tax=Cinnamomum micranthum f. kanehirae TaxID=337451 RepID=A0A3S3PRV2_9MAGN|nr:NAC domain-containing protein 83-like protein [Cinnamomum micranthum f. kanehirae]
MRPPAALTPSIDNHEDNLEMFDHLQSMMVGGPRPGNVITDVNPSTCSPWELSEEKLYFFDSRDATSVKGIRFTNVGYWQENGCTLTGPSNMAMITSLEFYTGQAPHGDRTGWMMLVYTIDRNSLGSSSLSRVFNRSDQSHSEEHPQAGSADYSDGDLDRALLMSLENEEINHNLQESSSKSQVLGRNERGLSAISGNDVQNVRGDNLAQDLNAYDFSRGDYFEENDLNDLGASFSCSENSSITSMSSDGIDQEEFLRILGTPAIPESYPEQYNSGLSLHDLETPAIPATNQRNSDCHHNVSIPQGLHHILIQPAPAGSIGTSRNGNPSTNVTVVSASVGSDHARAVPAAPVVEGRPVRRALNHGSAACEVNEVDQGPSTSRSAKVHGKRKAVSWRIAKIGKKYCCFFQF